jgi:hypothetical protein
MTCESIYSCQEIKRFVCAEYNKPFLRHLVLTRLAPAIGRRLRGYLKQKPWITKSRIYAMFAAKLLDWRRSLGSQHFATPQG